MVKAVSKHSAAIPFNNSYLCQPPHSFWWHAAVCLWSKLHFPETNQWKAPTGLSIQRISTCKHTLHTFTKIKNPQMCRDILVKFIWEFHWLPGDDFFTRRPSASRKKTTGESTCKQEVASSATTETAETTVQDMKVRSDMEPTQKPSQNGWAKMAPKSPRNHHGLLSMWIGISCHRRFACSIQ